MSENPNSLAFIDKMTRQHFDNTASELRLREITERLFARTMEWACADIERSTTHAVTKITDITNGGYRFEGAADAIDDLETTLRAALLAVLLAKRAHERKFGETEGEVQ